MPLIIKAQDRMAGNVTNARTEQRALCCCTEQEDVSAEDLSKQLENRHFIHQLLFPLGTIDWRVCVGGAVETQGDTINTRADC